MGTQTRPEGKARVFGENIESDLASRFLRVVEVAAIESARTMGQGERKLSDQVATEAMRRTMDSIPMRGTIVIGEGERDEAPMLYIGEKVGAEFPDGTEVPEVDIAVDPLEGTNLCATGAPGLLLCSLLLSAEACSTRPTATWTRSLSARRVKTRCISTRPYRTISRTSPGDWIAMWKTWL